jgi:hypothetical protein
LLVAAFGWPLASTASSAEAAPLYQWIDATGAVRYTPELARIPLAALPEALVLRRDPSSGAIVAFRWGESQPLARAAAPPETTVSAPSRERAELEFTAARRTESAASSRVGERVLPTPLDEPPEKLVAGDSGPPLYAIQLRATSLSAWLQPLQRSGLLAGHRLYRTRAEVEGQTWERLRLGFYATPVEARAALTRLQTSFPGAWVDRIDAAERGIAARAEIRPPSELTWGGAPVSVRPEAGHGYAIQLDAWLLDEGLRALTRLELVDRHRLYRTTVAVDGAVWERLRLGFFPKLEDARAVLGALARSFPDAWIARVQPDERIALAGTAIARAQR